MTVGVPKEVKPYENRVAITPAGVHEFRKRGHQVLLEAGAGLGSGFTDAQYQEAGAEILESAVEIYERAEMILKVKEPVASEYALLREDQIVFTFFHFAASRELTEAVLRSGCVAIAYETVQRADGSLPLLIPMSEVAGRMAIQEGAKYLEKTHGGKGVLLGGVPGVRPAHVLILGGGVVGSNAARIAAGMGAQVTILDVNLYRLRQLAEVMPANVVTQVSNEHTIRELLPSVDLVIGAVLIPGARAPHLITRDMLRLMRPGTVVIDVAVDQGGCIETCKPTTHENPTYVVDSIVHYCVANMPGAVPMTSTIALTNATLPYALELAAKGWVRALKENRELLAGANIIHGRIVYPGVAEAFGFPLSDLNEVLGQHSMV